MAPDRLPAGAGVIMASTPRRSGAPCSTPVAGAARGLRGNIRGDGGAPVTIRLLDPPLHEFLPAPEEATAESRRARMARCTSQPDARAPWLQARSAVFGDLRDAGPGDRPRRCSGSRAGRGRSPLVEIMLPLVGFGRSCAGTRADRSDGSGGAGSGCLCGTMIELPALAWGPTGSRPTPISSGSGPTTSRRPRWGSLATAEGKFLTFYLDHGIPRAQPVRGARHRRASAS